MEASIGGVRVRIGEMSAVGARLEHDERFNLANPELEIVIAGSSAMVPIRIVRSEIAGQRDGKLLYRTGIEFTGELLLIDRLIELIGGPAVVAPAHLPIDVEPAQARALSDRPAAEPPRPPAPSPEARSARPNALESLTPPAAEVSVRAGEPGVAPPAASLASPTALELTAHHAAGEDTWTRRVNFFRGDSDDDLPYARYRLDGNRWNKDYVATPDQPEDGFTLLRDDNDFAGLQRTYTVADPETRKMIRIALEAKLTRQGS